MHLLLVHGAITTVEVWRSLLPMLRAQVGVAGVDAIQLPGHPDGTVLGSVEAYADEIAALSRPDTWLVGYAMGGAIVLEAASRMSSKPAGLVLINASARMRVSHGLLAGAARDGSAQARKIWEATTDSPEARQILLTQADRLHPTTVGADLRAIDAWSRTGRLETVSHVPTLVIAGEEDNFVHPKHCAALADEIGAELAVLPGGHCLPLEKPELVSRLVLGFISPAPVQEEQA